MHVDIDILVFAVIAALVLGRLWSVLGSRNDGEPQRPNPLAAPPKREEAKVSTQGNAEMASAVARLPIAGPPPNSLEGGLAQIKAIDPEFDEKSFLQEARDIFTSIVGAYAAGRLMNVAEFLSPGLMAHFQQAVDARATAGQKAQTRIARIKDAEVLAAKADGARAYATVRFISDQENVLRDSKGEVIGGAAGKEQEVTDTWTFARDTNVKGVNWTVVETRG